MEPRVLRYRSPLTRGAELVAGKRRAGASRPAVSEARKRTRALAAKRSRLFRKKRRVAVGERGLLESLRDKSASGQDCARRMAELEKFCTQRELKLTTLQEVDIALTEYTDCLFVDGRPESDATNMKAALESLHPLALRIGP